MQIAFFDFDGTITSKDSFADFIKYAIGRRAYYIGLMKKSWAIVAYKIGIIPNFVAKEMVFSHFFRNWSIGDFKKCADLYSKAELKKIIKKEAKERIEWHQSLGHKVVVVSASIENWLREWCNENKVELIATKIKVENGKVTGKFASPNCYGKEKVNRINEIFDLSLFSHIYAYGDSRGDKEMLYIADSTYYQLLK